MKLKRYKVRGLLRKDDQAKQFTTVVSARSIHSANSIVKDIVRTYCEDNYPDKEEVKCIINKKTVRCD